MIIMIEHECVCIGVIVRICCDWNSEISWPTDNDFFLYFKIKANIQ